MVRRCKKRKPARIWFYGILVLAVLTGIVFALLKGPDSAPPDSSAPAQATAQPEKSPDPEEADWKLIPVNEEHPIPENYHVELLKLSNSINSCRNCIAIESAEY